MAKSRKRKAETEARLKALEDKLLEEAASAKDLCCNVNPMRACYKCPARFCMDHIESNLEYVRGKFICKRCLSIELLFEDLGACVVNRER
jgi:hypothetical protein